MGSVREQVREVIAYRFELGQFSFSVGGVIAAVLTFLAIWLLSRAMQRAFARHAGQREMRSRAAIYTLARIATYALYGIGVMLALSFLGIPTSRFAVLAGALGVGLGFGLQAIFSNLRDHPALRAQRAGRRLRRARVGPARRGAGHQHPLDPHLRPTTTSTSWCPTRSS